MTRGLMTFCSFSAVGVGVFTAALLLTTTWRTAVAADPQLPPVRGIGYPLVGPNGGLNQTGYKTTSEIIAEVKALGANTVRVTISAGLYSGASANTSDKAMTAQNTPSEAEFIAYIAALKAAGLKVLVVPYVNSFATGGDTLSGTVRTPTDINTFMADHTANVVRVARAAQAGGADYILAFMDDTEGLVRNTAYTALWLNHISQIKAVFSGQVIGSPGASGKIFGGAATHYELLPAEIMAALDMVGCTCLYEGELTNTNNPTVTQLQNGFRGANNGIDVTTFYEYVNRVYMKPLFLADTSYHSFDGSNRTITPIYNEAIPLVADEQEQADIFDANLAVLRSQKDKDWFQGITYSGQNALPANANTARFLKSAYGENIGGKRAEAVVRGWYTGTSPPADVTTTATANFAGGAGDDTVVIAGSGTRTIDGGAGTNTVVINGRATDYTISGSFLSAQVSGAGAQLALSNIHALRFTDQTVKLPTGFTTLTASAGVQTLTGSANDDLIATGLADQVVDPGLGNNIVVANPWYRNALRIRASRAKAFYGRMGARYVVTDNSGASPRWVSAVGISKIQFDDGEVTLPGDTLVGTASQTHLYGSPANDTISTARTGAVTIAGSAGDDVIDGGASSATVSYPEARANFTIAYSGSDIIVTKPNGTDTLRNIKTLAFADQNGTPGQLTAGITVTPEQGATYSLFRFENTGTAPGTVTMTFRDAATGQQLHQWTSAAIAPNSVLQQDLRFLELAFAARPAAYAMSIASSMKGNFQHVYWRPNDGTLANLTTCSAGVTANRTRLNSVHTSLVTTGYPSLVSISNTGTTAQRATLAIFDARDGTRLGTYTSDPIAPGAQLQLSVPVIEIAAGLKPERTELYHYNLQIEGAFDGYLQHIVINEKSGALTDMTPSCDLAGVTTAPPPTLRIDTVKSSTHPSLRSLLRFHNTGDTAGKVTVTARDSTTGATLGSWISDVIPPNAENQVELRIMEQSFAPGQKPAGYSVSVQSGISGYLQHVSWQPSEGTLTNITTCAAGVTVPGNALSAVHTSIIGPGYPSTIIVTNTGEAPARAALDVYDARDGTKVGSYVTPEIPAKGQLRQMIPEMEAAMGFTPTGWLTHYVVNARPGFPGFLQHVVNNESVGMVTDMTTACVLTKTQ